MNKALLLEKYITKAVKHALKEQEEQQQRAEKAMYFIHRFPGLKKTFEELMSPAFGRYVANVSLIAPKPTTFNVELINSQNFTIYYVGKGVFTAKISGKKYHPVSIGELERASQAIADLLELNYAPIESKEELASQRDASIKQDLENPELTPPTGAIPPMPNMAPEETPGEAPEEIPEEEPLV
jgi:hypothetical protein